VFVALRSTPPWLPLQVAAPIFFGFRNDLLTLLPSNVLSPPILVPTSPFCRIGTFACYINNTIQQHHTPYSSTFAAVSQQWQQQQQQQQHQQQFVLMASTLLWAPPASQVLP
jgi:hypothetical protein